MTSLVLESDLDETTESISVMNCHGAIRYVLKIANRPFYQPRDNDAIRKELENLKRFAGIPNIVQAAGLAASTNTYKASSGSYDLPVITGILLEAYTGGSL